MQRHSISTQISSMEFFFSKYPKVKKSLHGCMSCKIPDISDRVQADVELDSYKDKLRRFGSELAQRTISSRSPGINFLELMNLIHFFA